MPLIVDEQVAADIAEWHSRVVEDKSLVSQEEKVEALYLGISVITGYIDLIRDSVNKYLPSIPTLTRISQKNLPGGIDQLKGHFSFLKKDYQADEKINSAALTLPKYFLKFLFLAVKNNKLQWIKYVLDRVDSYPGIVKKLLTTEDGMDTTILNCAVTWNRIEVCEIFLGYFKNNSNCTKQVLFYKPAPRYPNVLQTAIQCQNYELSELLLKHASSHGLFGDFIFQEDIFCHTARDHINQQKTGPRAKKYEEYCTKYPNNLVEKMSGYVGDASMVPQCWGEALSREEVLKKYQEGWGSPFEDSSDSG